MKICLLLFAVILSSCGYVSKDTIDYSNSVCQNNGGLKAIRITATNTYSFECENGAMFEYAAPINKKNK